jgi:hypothetical protein
MLFRPSPTKKRPGLVVVAIMTTVIGGLLLRDTKDVDIKVGSGVEASQPI